MINVLYDFVGVAPIVKPYVGLGVGYQDVIEQNPPGGPTANPRGFQAECK